MKTRFRRGMNWSLGLGLAVFLGASTALADVSIGMVAPLTGQIASIGEQVKRGAEMAVADLNAAGGVNGEKIVLNLGDDACDPKQAVAAANQMVAKGVVFVVGHVCSGSSIPASKVYAEEGILQITPASTAPAFTDEGGWNVARACGRDDAQGRVAGLYLAKAFAGKKVAILHDKSSYGKGLADKTKEAMNGAGLKEALYEAFSIGEKDYSSIVSKLKAAQVDAVYIGGLHTEAGLILRQMRDQGLKAQLVGGDAWVTEEFWAITGDIGEGVLMTFTPDATKLQDAADVVKQFKDANYNPEGYTLYSYAAVQMWAQGAQAVGNNNDAKAVSAWLREGHPLKTVVGEISLDKKGDVKDAQYVWYRWSKGKWSAATDL